MWTSTLRRTQITAARMGRDIVCWKALDEIDAGMCDGMTYEEIARVYPTEYAARSANKFTYRYPRGESYQDIVHRLEPAIIELLRQPTPTLIVSHQATLRVLYAYLMDRAPETCPEVAIPLHTVIELTPRAYGCALLPGWRRRWLAGSFCVHPCLFLPAHLSLSFPLDPGSPPPPSRFPSPPTCRRRSPL